MAILDTLSKRLARAASAGKADVYQYDKLPIAFRVQVCHIWVASIGPFVAPDRYLGSAPCSIAWVEIHNAFAREQGVFELDPRSGQDPFLQCQNFLLKAETLPALDLIELTFQAIPIAWERWSSAASAFQRHDFNVTQSPIEAIAELNIRFREHAIGYRFENGQLIRIDSQFIHGEVVTPAIRLLHDAAFRGASQEFLKAHEHYRAGRYKEAINEALKSFESTMKTICDNRGWRYQPNVTAQGLIDLVFKNGLIPVELTSQFTALRSLLESGLPTIRNKQGAHGQGATPVAVPDYLAAYALHLAASNIVVLVSAHRRR
ncbi:MAG: hypothetical protein WEB52_08375 [Dehalococcoidia bacterium]